MRDLSEPQGPGRGALPLGLRVAGIRGRLAAWLVDSLLFTAYQVVFWLVAGAIGVVTVNPAAQQQLENSPFAMPTVSPYEANLPLLGALLAVFVLLNVVYATLFWALLRGLPGQKLAGLQVGSAADGKNLNLPRAFVRAVVAIGIPFGAVAVLMYSVMAVVVTVPWSDVVNPQSGGAGDVLLNQWATVMDGATLVAVGVPVLLLIWTVYSPRKQGLHDLLAGSLVVGNVYSPRAGSAYGLAYLYGPGGPAGPTYGPGNGPGYPQAPVPPGTPAWPPYPSPGQYGTPGVVRDSSEQPGVAGAPGGAEGTGPTDGLISEPQLPEPLAGPPSGDGGWEAPQSGPSLWRRGDEEVDRKAKAHAATVGRRVSAYILDCTVVMVVFVLLDALVAAFFLPSTTTQIDEKTSILMGLVGGLWQMAYFTVGWAVWRGTLGQRAMHLRVTDVTTGKGMSWMDSLVRWAVIQGPFALVTIVPIVASVPVMFAAMLWVMYLLRTTQADPDLRGLHDKFLNTRVALDL